jgi:hypothetical protein
VEWSIAAGVVVTAAAAQNRCHHTVVVKVLVIARSVELALGGRSRPLDKSGLLSHG